MSSTKGKFLEPPSALDGSSILFLHSRIYLRKIDDHMIIFNPDAGMRPLFIPYFLKTILDRINGRRTVNQIIKGFIGNRSKALLFLDLLSKHYIISINYTFRAPYFPRYAPKELKVWLHVTNACNFSCPYCFIKKTAVHMSMSILQQSIDRTMKQAHQLAIPRVLFILAGGEPLLRKEEILFAVRRAKKIGKEININPTFCIISNGSLLTEEYAEELKSEGIILSISIDSWFEKSQVTRTLGSGINALPYIKKGIDVALRHNILQAISITISKDNIEFLPKTIAYFLDVSPNIDIHFNMYFKPTTQKTDMKGTDKAIIDGMKKTYSLLFANAEKTGISPLIKYRDLIYGIDWFSPKTYACNAGTEESIVIMHDGTVRACPAVPKTIGTIKNKHFLEAIKQNPTARLNVTPVSEIGDCDSCLWKHMCGGGCQAERINLHKEKPIKSRYCNIYKVLIPYILYLEGKRLMREYLKKIR